ncbi:MAG: hypothetical protein ACTSR1_10315 [Candidatus Heimdallarchaeota archaeon]
MVLFCINILILFLAPFATSEYDGINIASIRIIIDFKVGFLGNWLELTIFPVVHEEFITIGTAEEIGSYSNLIITFIILALFFSLLGSVLISANRFNSENTEKAKKIFFIFKIIGAIITQFGGVFGIFSLHQFSKFKSSIIISYVQRGFIASNKIPPIKFTYGFICCLVIFILFTSVGFFMLIFSVIEIFQNRKHLINDNQSIDVLSENSNILPEGLSMEEKDVVSDEKS